MSHPPAPARQEKPAQRAADAAERRCLAGRQRVLGRRKSVPRCRGDVVARGAKTGDPIMLGTMRHSLVLLRRSIGRGVCSGPGTLALCPTVASRSPFVKGVPHVLQEQEGSAGG